MFVQIVPSEMEASLL